MGLSKETRIKLFIAIDVAFFLLEIIVGRPQLVAFIARRTMLTNLRLCCSLACSGG